MENDSIRASGTDTLVDIWINGKVRAISISREAIASCVGFEQGGLSDDERCEWVRTNLPQVVSAVKTRLVGTDPTAESVTIDVGQLGGNSQRDRRKGDRRKTSRQPKDLPHGERRRGNRRKSDQQAPKG